MAFGKDARGLHSAGNFRQSTGRATSFAGKSSKPRGGIPYFVDMYQPSTMDIDRVRLVAGAYLQDQVAGSEDTKDLRVEQVVLPFIKFSEHFYDRVKKGIICSAGPFANFKGKRAECYGCDIFWDTVVRSATGRLESTAISRQNKYALSIYDFGDYHKMEQIDRDTGAEKIDPKTKKPYFNWVKCQRDGCDACRAEKEKKSGHMSHWPITYTQLQVLRSSETNIGKYCAVCTKEDSISSHGWMCQSCGECVIDMATTGLKKAELVEMTDKEHTCAACNFTGFLSELFECRYCSQQGVEGARASLFDVDLRLQTVMNGKDKLLQVAGWSIPYKLPPAVAEIAKPIDLVARYAPDPLERQALKFGITNVSGPRREPQTNGTPEKSYTVPYGDKPQA